MKPVCLLTRATLPIDFASGPRGPVDIALHTIEST